MTPHRPSSRFLSLLSALALPLAGLTACGGATSSEPTTPLAPVDAADAAAFARASNSLGLDLFGQLRGDGTANLAISPASISTALAMTYGGARGDTARVMASGLHVTSGPDATLHAAGSLVRAWNDPDRSAYTLSVANRLFGERTYGFRPEFLTATREDFGAELELVDFVGASEPARASINSWVASRTHDRIPEILPGGSVDGDTRLVLVNAVYFHGRWAIPFDASATSEGTFTTATNDSVRVPMMRRSGGRYGEDAGVQLYELPYAGDEVSMLFVLPTDRGGLSALEASLDAADVARWASRVAPSDDVIVALPRFRLEGDPLSLKQALERLGMRDIFTPAADFSGMSAPGEQALFVSDVFHRVFVELDEEGTEAAAATAVVMTLESASAREPDRFIADHPFLFFLRDQRTGAILFAGRVANPR